MILFFYGLDAYRLREAVTDVLAKARTDHAISSVSADADQEPGRLEIERILKYPSFFREPTFIIVHNVLRDADTAETFRHLLEHYDVAAMPDITVVACHAGPVGRESAATKALIAYLTHHAHQVASFSPLTGPELARWISEYCATRQCSIAPDARALLARRMTGDSWALAGELEKLCAYASSRMITVDMVHLLTPPQQERNEFELANALASNNKRGAIAALFKRLKEGTPEHMLLGSLAYSVRTLLTVTDLAEQRIPASAMSQRAGVPPFVVTNILRGISTYTMDTLTQAHRSLAQLDRDVKNGQADVTDGLFSVILNL